MIKNILALVLCIGMASGAAAGPFGIDQGQPKSSLDIAGPDESPNSYVLKSVPKPHPLFITYSVVATDKLGVCRINAGSKVFENDRYGTQVRSKFDELATQLNGIYGKSKDYKFLRSGALWDEPQDWVMGLYKKERIHVREWSVSNGSKMKDGISAIALRAAALSGDRSLIVIHYLFENESACKEELKSSSTDSL